MPTQSATTSFTSIAVKAGVLTILLGIAILVLGALTRTVHQGVNEDAMRLLFLVMPFAPALFAMLMLCDRKDLFSINAFPTLFKASVVSYAMPALLLALLTLLNQIDRHEVPLEQRDILQWEGFAVVLCICMVLAVFPSTIMCYLYLGIKRLQLHFVKVA